MASVKVLFLVLTTLIASESVNATEENDRSCSGTTCYGWCCPFTNAVCCSDGNQCCPSRNICLPSLGLCLGFKSANSTLVSQETAKAEIKRKNVVSLCPSGMTQCGSGCCPLPSAVCCSDGTHCCPSGYTCNYIIGGCVRGRLHSPFLDKLYF